MPLWTPNINHPGYISGNYYNTWPHRMVTAGAAVAAIDIIYFYPFNVQFPITVKTLVIRVVALGAGSSLKSAIWADSPVSHRPLGAPLIVDNTGQTTQANNTNVEADTTDTALGPGWYWAGSKFTGTLPTVITTDTSEGHDFYYHGGTIAAIARTGLSFADTYSNNMPTLAEGASFTEVTTGACVLALKV